MQKKNALLGTVYNPGALIKRAVARIRSSFMIDGDGYQRGGAKKLQTEEFFNMDYNVWLGIIHNQHLTKEGMIHFPTVDSMVAVLKPPATIRAFITAFDKKHSKTHPLDEQAVESQQLDLYYANLVHGASIRVPLAEIWCAANEMEHSDRDTGEFFAVMWKGLRDVLDTSITSQMQNLTTGGRSSGAIVGRVQARVETFPMSAINGEEFIDNLVKSVKRCVNLIIFLTEIHCV